MNRNRNLSFDALARLASILVAAAAALAMLPGCPGSLENPERFGGGGCMMDVQADIFTARCGTSACHDNPSGGVDLVNIDPAMLVDRPATATAEGGMCEGMGLIIDTGSIQDSLLLSKLSGAPPCGDPMPLLATTPLSAQEMNCIEEFVMDTAAGGGGPTDAGGGGSDSGGGGSDAGGGSDGGM